MNTSTTTFAARLEGIAGAENVSVQPKECAKYAVDGHTPSAVVRPGSAEEAAEIVRFAAAEKLAVIPCGGRTKLCIGMPPSRYGIALDMTRLDQVAHYDPGDLTLSVDAGMRLKDLAKMLKAKGQFLPLGAPFFETSTVGGTIASGVDTPLRQGYGTARDYLIGAEFVTGEGARGKSGGRVVKNVTGYDLHKLLIGSLGTLAVITRLNFRTFPRPAVRRGFLAAFKDEQEAVGFRQKVISSPLTPSLLEIVSPEATRILFGAGSPIASLLAGGSSWHVCAGFEGTQEVCERYTRELPRIAQEAGSQDALLLREAQYAGLAERLREAVPLLMRSSPQPVVFRFSGLPAETTTLVRALRSFAASTWIPSAQVLRGRSALYLALLATGLEESLFKQVAYFWKSVESLRGKIEFHASIPYCPAEWKRELNIWGAPRLDVAMMQRVKKAFDPQGILAPGRFVGGI
jgi:glycolate dehydrogenase FAD-binding subunit